MEPCLLRHKVYLAAKDGDLKTLKHLLKNLNKEAAVEILSHHTEEDGQLRTPLIVAAQFGNKQITKWLLSKYNIDVEQTGTVYTYYEYPTEGVTALWLALIRHSHSIVRQLLKHGADPNHPQYNSKSPLLFACSQSRPAILDALIKHGADVNAANDNNETCLMETCSRYCDDINGIVKLLLVRGADINAKSCDGSTALHKAAKCGQVDVVKTLLHYKATMEVDDLKMTPLLVAAEHQREKVVKYLVSLPNCTLQHRVDAFELLGASCLTKQEELEPKAFKYFQMGMRERYRDLKNPLLKTLSPPKSVYGNHIECQTLDEIKSIAENIDALRMEALSVRERILGEDNPFVVDFISDLAMKYYGTPDVSIKLWLHAMSLTHKYKLFQKSHMFAIAFQYMSDVNADIDYVQLLQAFEFMITAIENGMGNSEQNTEAAFNLIIIMLEQCPTKKQIEVFHQAVYRFLKLEPRYYYEYTPLHMSLVYSLRRCGCSPFKIFPNEELCDLLVNCGADVNALDNEGNTPLHVLVEDKRCVVNSESVKRCVLILIRHGAHLDIKNKSGKTAIEVSVMEEFKEIIQSNSKISLKCLASRAIKRHGIVYKNKIPKSLEIFVDWHKM